MSEQKFDFQNIDLKLYLALSAICKDYLNLCEDAGGVMDSPPKEYVNAQLAMAEFEQSLNQLPHWAIARNWHYSLVPGAQLCTRDGRKTGNAHIVSIEQKAYPHLADRNNPYGEVTVYNCLTDAGSKLVFTAQELETAFTFGDWISDPARIIRDFDRNKEFEQHV